MFLLFFCLYLVFTYFIFGNVLALPFLKLLETRKIDSSTVILTSLGLAPGIVSLILYFSLLIIPKQSRFVYIGIVSAVFLATLILARSAISSLTKAYKRGFSNVLKISGSSFLKILLGLIIIGAFLYVPYKAVLFPIQTDDALIHATHGRIIYEERSIEHFSNGYYENGFNHPTKYPPGLHLLYTWSYLLKGSINNDWAVRVVSSIYVLLTLLLIWRWGERVRRGSGIFATFALITVPIYSHQAACNSIDAMRIFFFIAALFWTYQLIKIRLKTIAALAAISLGLAVYTHILGWIALPVAVVMYFLFAKKYGWSKFTLAVVLIVFIGLALGGFEYGRRFIMLGNPFGVRSTLPTGSTQQILENRGVGSSLDVIFYGYLQIFTEYSKHGIIAWLSLGILAMLLLKRFKNTREISFILMCAGLTLIFIYLLPSGAAYSNSRYTMTVAPLLALGTGVFLNDLSSYFQTLVERTLKYLSKARTGNLKSSVLKVGLIGIGFLSLLGCAILSPTFVARYLSPDHILSTSTVNRLHLLQSIGGVFGIVFLLAGIFPKYFKKMMGFISTNSGKGELLKSMVCKLPIIVLIVFMLFIRVDNLMWSKTGGISTYYGLKTLFLSDEQKMTSWGWVGHKASVFFINKNTEEDSLVLVTEESPFFYYGKRDGILWRDQKMKPFYEAESLEEAYSFLLSMGINYLQISNRTTQKALFKNSYFPQIIANTDMCELIWNYQGPGPTKVYRLKGK